jgi:hypothetical protein
VIDDKDIDDNKYYQADDVFIYPTITDFMQPLKKIMSPEEISITKESAKGR